METIIKLLNEIGDDRTVPKNIRSTVEEVKTYINNKKMDIAVRINNAISLLDEVSNDPNIPIYTRTHIWNIVSMLEAMNKSNSDKSQKI